MNERQPLILVVDDNPTNIKVLFEILESVHFHVLVSKSGESVLEKLKVVTPDLILLDVMMPDINGFEVCRQLKEQEATQNIPVIFMTALSEETDKTRGFNLGAIDYITKPFEQEEVLARVRLHLKEILVTRSLAEKVTELTNTLTQLQQSQLPQVQQDVRALLNLVQLYQQHYPEPIAAIQTELDRLDLETLHEELPQTLDSLTLSGDRLANIARSLNHFSFPDALDFD